MDKPSVPVVFFGPAHAGKSTLIGYLLATFRPDIDAEFVNRQVEYEYPYHYDASQYYAYLVDEARSERVRGVGATGLGTSKFVHFHRVGWPSRFESNVDPEFMLIDTPGSSLHYRDRIVGLTLGEVGVFVIPINVLEKNIRADRADSNISYSDRLRFGQLMEPLDLWMGLSGSTTRRSIVYISKLDRAEKDVEETVFLARQVLSERHGKGLVYVTGGSILAKDRTSSNIIEPELAWKYFDFGLCDLLSKLFLEILEDDRRHFAENKSAWCVVDRKIRLADQEKPAVRCKVASGAIRRDDEVWLGPGHANRSIRATKESFAISRLARVIGGDVPDIDIETANEGEIVNIVFRGSRFNDYELDRNSIILLNSEEPVLRKQLKLSLKSTDDDLAVGRQVSLIWTGKVSQVKIVSRDDGFMTVEPVEGADVSFLVPQTLSQFPGLGDAVISLDQEFRKTFPVCIND